MGLFDWLKERKGQANGQQGRDASGLSQSCYQMAYFVLPPLLFSDKQRVLGYFANPEVDAAQFLYVMTCQAYKSDPAREDVARFRAHAGELSPQHAYYAVEYPVPPPVAFNLAKAVLAPHFSAIVEERHTGAVSYFILGQSPAGGTTLRTITAEGVNANLGPGPEPELGALLAAIRGRLGLP